MVASGVNSGRVAWRSAVLGAVLLAGAGLAAGCSEAVKGHAVAAGAGSAVTLQSPGAPQTPSGPGSGSRPGEGAKSLSALLPGAADFPAGYAAQPLPHRDAVEAAADLTGVHPGAAVEPLRCTPARLPTDPADMAMITATSGQGNSTLSVLLTRPGADLAQLRTQLGSCLKAEVSQFGARSMITRQMEDDPAVPADGALAYTQKVTSGNGHLRLTQASLTQVAQVDGVRVTVTSMALASAGGEAARPDAAAVTGLLQRSVATLRGH